MLLSADVNLPYPEGFACRNPYWTLTVRTDGTDFSFPCVNGFVCRNSRLKPTCTTRYLNHSPRIVCIKLPMVARAVFTPSRKTAGSIPFFSTNKKDCVPTYCAAIDFPYFQALGIPKWTPAATPDTDEDIVQAHGHHLFLRCQRRGVSDPSNLRTCVLESIRWTRLRGGRGMSRWISPFHAIWGQHKYTSETGETSPVFFRPRPFSASAGWDLSLTRIRWAGVAWNDPGSA